jgi:uncharacterized protein YjgD (DUF1641 family)
VNFSLKEPKRILVGIILAKGNCSFTYKLEFHAEDIANTLKNAFEFLYLYTTSDQAMDIKNSTGNALKTSHNMGDYTAEFMKFVSQV